MKFSANLDWEMRPLQLEPGESLVYWVRATDNRRLSESDAGQAGVSVPMSLKVISETEFEERVRSDLSILEGRLRQIVQDQAGLNEKVRLLGEELVGAAILSDSSRTQAVRASYDQHRLVRPLVEVAERLVRLAVRIERNTPENEAAPSRLRTMGDTLRLAAQGPVTEAGTILQRAAEASGAAGQRTALTDARQEQREALESIQAILRSLAEWGGIQSLMTRVHGLLERQGALRTDTGSLGRRTLGKTLESLSQEETAELRRLRFEQEQLTQDAERLLERMLQAREEPSTLDSATAEALDEAIRSARAHELTQRMKAASAAIRENRSAGAAVEQKAAEQAMRHVLKALRSHERLILAELKKRLLDARQQVAVLIEDLTNLREATREAGALEAEISAYLSLEREQHRIRINTEGVAEELGADERTMPHASSLRDAALQLADAELELRAASADKAVVAQDRALGLLREVLNGLDELAERAEEEAFRQTLAGIREELVALHDAQAEINGELETVKRNVDRAGQVGRSHVRELVRLSRKQGVVRAMVDEIMPELERVIVYRWAMERVAGWMEDVRSFLYERRADDEVVETAHRIVDEISKLISALEETEAMPLDTDFIEAETSGGATDTAASKPVPTVAELLVLKTLQLDINERTRQMAKTLDRAQPSESQLRRLQAIGEDQTEVRRLSELLTQRARR